VRKLHLPLLAPAFAISLLWAFVAIGSMAEATSGGIDKPFAEKVFARGPQLRLVLALGACDALYALNAWFSVRRIAARHETVGTRILCGLTLLLAPLMAILLAGFCIELSAYLDRQPS
jgi:hypothetical protein